MASHEPQHSRCPAPGDEPNGPVSEVTTETASPVRPPHRLPPRRPPSAQSQAPDAETTVFPDRLFDRPNSVFVYGPSRPLVNLTLFALARGANPDFEWVDIVAPTQPRSPCDPVSLGWIPEDRLWVVPGPDSLRPDDRAASLPLFQMIRSDESPETLARLREFLSLPETSQRILSDLPAGDRPGVVAVTNIHRVEGAFSADRIPPLLSAHRDAGFSVMVAYAGEAAATRDLFDFVFRLQGQDDHFTDWKRNQLVCEKGIGSGPLRELRPVHLEDVPLVADVVSRARPSPWSNHPHGSS